MDEQSPSAGSSTSSPTEDSLSNGSTNSSAGVLPWTAATDWRDSWTSGTSKLSSEAIGELLDLDMRLSALPVGTLRDKLGRWLDDVGGNLVLGSLQPPHENHSSNPLHPLDMLRHHIMFADFVCRNLRLAHSLAWLVSILFWGLVSVILSFYSPTLPTIPGFASPEIGQLWVLIFVAGVTGSATAGLWRIYMQDFAPPSAFAYVPPKQEWTASLRTYLFLRLTLDEAIRAIVRPVVGGLFAWIITLILLSGLLLEPLVSPFVTEGGVIDTENTSGEMFFLAIAVVAGFSEGWVISLLERVRSDVQQ